MKPGSTNTYNQVQYFYRNIFNELEDWGQIPGSF